MGLSVCAQTFNNSGTIDCSPIIDYATKIIFVPTFDSTGARNRIPTTAVFTQANLQALIDNADPTKRWYPTTLIDNIGGERAAASFETGSTGRRYKTRPGVRTFSFDVMEQFGVYLAMLESYGCTEMSFFKVDAKGNNIGNVLSVDDGYFYPTRISKNSMDSIMGEPMPDKTVKTTVSFEIDIREKDSLIRVMELDPLVMTANLLDAEGLNNVYSTISGIATTGFVADLFAKHNGLKKVPITGLAIGDFYDVRGGVGSKVYNITTSAAVTLTSVTESATIPGRYTFVYAAQTSGNIIRLTPVKTQLDFTAVVSSTILTP